MKKIYLLFTVVLLLAGCSSSATYEKKAYFELSYLNYAWGYVRQGWLIDEDGRVLSFHNPKTWNSDEDGGYITQDALSNNILYCDSTIRTIPLATLSHYRSLIPSALSGKISDNGWVGCDGGTVSYICYYYDSTKGKYKKVVLKQSGDYSCENVSASAQSIITWMESISKQ
ncbi:MAG: hypothetical protein H6Q17_1854 [Bacteroidetes bacterium]|nr:hypothetical protein [Bacteroidota bacterium]